MTNVSNFFTLVCVVQDMGGFSEVIPSSLLTHKFERAALTFPNFPAVGDLITLQESQVLSLDSLSRWIGKKFKVVQIEYIVKEHGSILNKVVHVEEVKVLEDL